MAQNTDDSYRKFRYYEGVCSSKDFIKELAQVLALGVRSDAITDSNGNVIEDGEVLRLKNWDIVYPQAQDIPNGSMTAKELNADYLKNVENLTTHDYVAKIKNQVSLIKNSVVLRTTTTPKVIAKTNEDNLSVSGDVEETSKTMYVQFYKPEYLANPEEYPLDAEMQGLTPQLITKEMYAEARKSTGEVLFDLSKLADQEKINFDGNKGVITSEEKIEQVDSVSNAYTYEEVFDADYGINKKFVNAVGKGLEEPSKTNPSTYLYLDKAYLNSIKNSNQVLYQFLFDICGLHSTFKETDWDIINDLRIQLSRKEEDNGDVNYYFILTYNKKVEIFTINTKQSQSGLRAHVYISDENGKKAIDNIRPELYSEGRYVPIPEEYLDGFSTDGITFTQKNNQDIKFSLDKVVNEDVYYGTIVVRYQYSKDNNYVDISSLKITNSVALPNNHYICVRMFDVPNLDFSGPMPNISDKDGTVTTINSHTSPWSKLSWYRDFEEIMMDSIDEDVSVTSVTDGTLLVPLETSGLTEDTRLSYWINTNNNRFSLIVMGNPALDYERDRHLISSCYIGQIESFEDSINDTSGNFALYTSSSTIPCKVNMKTYKTDTHIDRQFINDSFIDSKTAIVKDKADPDYGKSVVLTAAQAEANIKAYIDYSNSIGGSLSFTNITKNDLNVYYITLSGNKYFIETEMPRYMIIDNTTNLPVQIGTMLDGTPMYYNTVTYRQFIYGSSDTKSKQVALYIPKFGQNVPQDCTIYFSYGLYEEKFVIKSGITRDTFGNVIDIQTNDDYGKNTSDGVTSVSMYHTRSKAFYQKHHFLFATTEEYMSKVMYGKSSYTGEYYADRIKITHGNDGPRGILSDTLVIDGNSLFPKDELVINKDFKNPNEIEETFTYFPITAPYSPLSDGPNARYGIAIKKSEEEPKYTDDSKILRIAKNDLDTKMYERLTVEDDIELPSETSNGCKIYWEVCPNTETEANNQWIEDTTNGTYVTLDMLNGKNRSFKATPTSALNTSVTIDEPHVYNRGGNNTLTEIPVQHFTLSQGSEKTDVVNFVSKVKVDTVDVPSSTTAVYYGYSKKPFKDLRKGFSLFKTVNDGTKVGCIHRYPYYDMYVDINNPIITKADASTTLTNLTDYELSIYNATPDKYLNLFVVEEGPQVESYTTISNGAATTVPVNDIVVNGYGSALLNNENVTKDSNGQVTAITNSLFDLLQYPYSILAYATGRTDTQTQGFKVGSNGVTSDYDVRYVEYKKEHFIRLTGHSSGTASMVYSDYPTFKIAVPTFANALKISEETAIDDIFINVSFS